MRAQCSGCRSGEENVQDKKWLAAAAAQRQGSDEQKRGRRADRRASTRFASRLRSAHRPCCCCCLCCACLLLFIAFLHVRVVRGTAAASVTRPLRHWIGQGAQVGLQSTAFSITPWAEGGRPQPQSLHGGWQRRPAKQQQQQQRRRQQRRHEQPLAAHRTGLVPFQPLLPGCRGRARGASAAHGHC